MSIKRGDFVLKCDHEMCGTLVELETDDFNEAKELALDHKSDNGWTTVARGNTFKDFCDRH